MDESQWPGCLQCGNPYNPDGEEVVDEFCNQECYDLYWDIQEGTSDAQRPAPEMRAP